MAGAVCAGELEVDDQQRLTRWSNLSGTYQCPDRMSFQANLPLDKFYAVMSPSDNRSMKDVPTEELPRDVLRLKPDLHLCKALSFTEAELVNEKKAWAAHLGNMISANEEAADCQARLNQMINQRKIAVDTYGYLCTLTNTKPPALSQSR